MKSSSKPLSQTTLAIAFALFQVVTIPAAHGESPAALTPTENHKANSTNNLEPGSNPQTAPRPPASTQFERNTSGPYQVGVMTVDLIDPTRNSRHLRTEIWYPVDRTTHGAVYPYSTGIPTSALRNAPIAAGGPFPFVIFSHSLSALREQSTFLTEYLASRGYVVASPDHQFNTGRDFKPLEIYQSALDRPIDVRVVVDELLRRNQKPGDRLFGKIDPDRGGMVGHSLGGYTALAVGGALVNVTDFSVAPDKKAGEPYKDLSDPRLKAVVALAPVIRPAFDATSFAQLKRPTLVVGASGDTITPIEDHQKPVFECAGGPCTLAIIDGASHFSFNNEEMLLRAPFLIRKMHNPTIDRNEFEEIVVRLTSAFLDQHLKGDLDAGKRITTKDPQVEIQTRPGKESSPQSTVSGREATPSQVGSATGSLTPASVQ